jgi:hypothetical protein
MMMLADYAQAVNGKLYIVGGGWNILYVASPTAVAIQMHVSWDLTNARHTWRLELLDSDGAAVVVPGPVEEQAVALEGDFEVGRPPGAPLGSEQGVVLAINLAPLPLTAGARYEWRLSVNGQSDENWRLPFSFMGQPEALPPHGDPPA